MYTCMHGIATFTCMYTCAAKSTLTLEKDDKLTCSKDSFSTSVSPGELAVVVNFRLYS